METKIIMNESGAEAFYSSGVVKSLRRNYFEKICYFENWKEEKDLYKKWEKTGDRKIYQRFYDVAAKVAFSHVIRKYMSHKEFDPLDLFMSLCELLHPIVKKYNPDRARFVTYCVSAFRNRSINAAAWLTLSIHRGGHSYKYNRDIFSYDELNLEESEDLEKVIYGRFVPEESLRDDTTPLDILIEKEDQEISDQKTEKFRNMLRDRLTNLEYLSVYYRYFLDMPIAEVAKEIEVPYKTVDNALFRSKRYIVKMLEEE